jgi:ferredoxin-thioredoxin reductase catalytic subunit
MDTILVADIPIIEFHDTELNMRLKDKILARIVANDGYCPCVPERNRDTLCACTNYIKTHNCHCSLYIKKKHTHTSNFEKHATCSSGDSD